MINITRIGLKKYKSFNGWAVLDGLGNVNLIIGKNNSGKSSVLDIVEYIFDKNLILTNKPEEVIVGQILTEQVLESAFGKNTYGGSIGGNHYMYGSNFKNRDLTYTLSRSIDNSYSIAHTKNSVELAEVIDNNRAKC